MVTCCFQGISNSMEFVWNFVLKKHSSVSLIVTQLIPNALPLVWELKPPVSTVCLSFWTKTNEPHLRMPLWCWLLCRMSRVWQSNLWMLGKLWNIVFNVFNIFLGCYSERKLEQLFGHERSKLGTLYLQLQRWRIVWSRLRWTIQTEN